MGPKPPPPPQPKFVLRDGTTPISCIAFGLADCLYAGTQDGWVHEWDLTINRKKSSFQAGNAVCLAVKVFPDRIITQIKGDGFRVFIPSRGFELQHQFQSSHIGFCKIEVDFDETCSKIFTPEENGEVKVVSLDSLKVESTLSYSLAKLGEVMVMKLIKSINHKLLLVGYESGDIWLWDTIKGNCISKLKTENVPMAIDFDSDEGKGICGTESNSVILFNVDANFNIKIYNSLTLTNPGVSAITIRPDKKIFILGCWDGNIRVYSWKSGKPLAVLDEHLETINDLCYPSKRITSWDSVLLAVASKDKTISLWSFY